MFFGGKIHWFTFNLSQASE